jgi:hypothetical protein
MNKKDIIILGIIIGIGCFFIGAIISKVFPSDEASLLSYKVSAMIKLLGLGVLTTTAIIGGLVIEDIDPNLKIFLLLFGLILLVIYAAASPLLEWRIPSYSDSQTGYESRPTAFGMPGFEILVMFLALGVVVLLTYRKARR